MATEKCDSCKLRYVCEEQAEFMCKHNNYCDYSPDIVMPTITNKGKKRLKPCPFCGGTPRAYKHKNFLYGVTCQKCGAKVSGYGSAGAATKAWNRRATNEID